MPPQALLRFVVAPDGRLMADLSAQLPSAQEVWLKASQDIVDAAISQNIFAKIFSGDVQIEANLPIKILDALKASALRNLGLMRKTGKLICGFESLSAALKNDKAAAVIMACDSADTSRQKILRHCEAKHIPCHTLFGRAELTQAAGHTDLVYAAITDHQWASLFTAEVERIIGYNNMIGERK